MVPSKTVRGKKSSYALLHWIALTCEQILSLTDVWKKYNVNMSLDIFIAKEKKRKYTHKPFSGLAFWYLKWCICYYALNYVHVFLMLSRSIFKVYSSWRKYVLLKCDKVLICSIICLFHFTWWHEYFLLSVSSLWQPDFCNNTTTTMAGSYLRHHLWQWVLTLLPQFRIKTLRHSGIYDVSR